MLKRIIQIVAIIGIMIAIVLNIFPEAASAKTCQERDITNISQSQWQCAKSIVEKDYDVTVSGNKGKVNKFTCAISYDYKPSSEELDLTPDSGWICPVSCSTLTSKLNSEVEKVEKRCGILDCKSHPDDQKCYCPSHPDDQKCYCYFHPDDQKCYCPSHPDDQRCYCPSHPDDQKCYCYFHPNDQNCYCPSHLDDPKCCQFNPRCYCESNDTDKFCCSYYPYKPQCSSIPACCGINPNCSGACSPGHVHGGQL